MYHLILNVLVFFLPLLHGDKSTASNPDIKEGNEAYTVSFYPEGGRLILNTACVVAFKAESRDGKTLDISGEIVDDRGNIVQNVKSLYNGLGYFNIYPNEGRTYYLNCKSTEGIEKSFILPAATLSIGIKVHFKEDQILVSVSKPEHLQFKDTLYILLQSEDSIVYKDIWDFSRRWIVFEKKDIKTGLSSFLLVDSNDDLLSGRPFFKLENISSLQSLPPDFKIRLLPIMNDPGTDSIRKNLVLDTLAKTLTIDQEQSEPDKRPDDDIWKTIELENVEIKAFKKDKQNQGLYSPVQASSRIYKIKAFKKDKQNQGLYSPVQASSRIYSSQDIERWHINEMKSLLSRFSGVKFIFDDVKQKYYPVLRDAITSFRSKNEGKPLVVIDDTPFIDFDILDYPVNDIEEMFLLKGSDAAIWGPKASNGIIVIITQRGKSTKIEQKEK